MLTECKIWLGAANDKGYGQKTIARKTFYVHRLAYQEKFGPIPSGLQIDHLCKNKRCFNPDHLEAVTPRENQMRSNGMGSVNSKKTHCINGHEFTEQNTYVRKSGSRQCRACKNLRMRMSGNDSRLDLGE